MWVRSAVRGLALATWALACGCSSEGDDDTGSAGSGGAGTGGSAGMAATSGSGAVGGSTTTTPSVDPTKDVESLDATETAELCDWSVALLGPGYGVMNDCQKIAPGQNLIEQTWADQATCVRLLFIGKCEFTVAEWEACVSAQAPTKACVTPDACDDISCLPE